MAGRIPEEFITEVRNNVNIVDLISQYVSLEKKGKDYLGLCPFHQEKTPSFTVNEEKQFFKCFGCGKGGNVFKFLMYQDNLTFPEAVTQVAEFAHIPVPSSIGQHSAPMSPLMKLHDEAAKFYHQVMLTTNAGQVGKKYAEERGLDSDSISHFQIGYAPNKENLLLTFLRDKGYSDEELVKSGLFVQSQDGRLFDRFRDRLMFPLDDESGRVIAFSGRRISDNPDEPKYLNSPETEIFNKSKALFHFSEAKRAARQEKHLVLLEGYMDVISAYKAGVKSGIASMGTSLTEQQIYLMKRANRNIVINYDGDDPGVHAAERASNMFEKANGFNVGVVILPEKLDPDEFVKKYGPERYQDEIKGAMSLTDFLLKRLADKYNLNNDREKIAYINDAIAQIATLNNPVERDLYIDKIAREQGVTTESLKANLMRETRKQRRANRNKQSYQSFDSAENFAYDNDHEQASVQEQDVQQFDQAQTRLLYLFIHSEDARKIMMKEHFLFPDHNYAQLAELWLKFIQTHQDISLGNFLDFIPEPLQGIIVNAEMKDMPQSFSEREISDIIQSLTKRDIDKQLNELFVKIQDAERRSDNLEILKLTQEIIKLKRMKG